MYFNKIDDFILLGQRHIHIKKWYNWSKFKSYVVQLVFSISLLKYNYVQTSTTKKLVQLCANRYNSNILVQLCYFILYCASRLKRVSCFIHYGLILNEVVVTFLKKIMKFFLTIITPSHKFTWFTVYFNCLFTWLTMLFGKKNII